MVGNMYSHAFDTVQISLTITDNTDFRWAKKEERKRTRFLVGYTYIWLFASRYGSLFGVSIIKDVNCMLRLALSCLVGCKSGLIKLISREDKFVVDEFCDTFVGL